MTERARIDEPAHERLAQTDYSGLYGRLFLASKDPTGPTAYLNPDLDVDVPAALSSRKRNYTRITQKLSGDEREKAWEHLRTFDERYERWQDGVIQAVNSLTDTPEDMARLEALRLAMQDGRRASLTASNFTKADVKALFDDFCNGNGSGDSDTTAFIERAIANSTIDGKVDAQKLATLEWVSRKLFGEKAASAVSRALELEVEIRNRPHFKTIKNTLFSDPTRVNNLNAEEKEMLEYLCYGLDRPTNASTPTHSAVPVPPGSSTGSAVENPPAPKPGNKAPETRNTRAKQTMEDIKQALDATNEDFDMIIPKVDLSDFLATRLGSIVGDFSSKKVIIVDDAEQIVLYGPQYRFIATDEPPIIGADKIIFKATIKGTKINFDLVLSNYDGAIRATIPNYPRALELIKISEVVGGGTEETTLHEKIAASLEDFDTRFKEEVNGAITTTNPQWEYFWAQIIAGAGLNAAFIRTGIRPPNSTQPEDELATPPITSIKPMGQDHPATPEVIAGAEPKPVMPRRIDDIELEGKDLAKELNANLLNQTNPDATFNIPIETLKEYLTSIAGDKLKSPGSIILNQDRNEINIRGLRIDGGFLGGKITLDILITNSSKGISAQVQNYDGRGGLIRGTVEQQVASLDSRFKEIVNGLIIARNPAWRPNNITIVGNRIRVGFHNTSVSKGSEPTT